MGRYASLFNNNGRPIGRDGLYKIFQNTPCTFTRLASGNLILVGAFSLPFYSIYLDNVHYFYAAR